MRSEDNAAIPAITPYRSPTPSAHPRARARRRGRGEFPPHSPRRRPAGRDGDALHAARPSQVPNARSPSAPEPGCRAPPAPQGQHTVPVRSVTVTLPSGGRWRRAATPGRADRWRRSRTGHGDPRHRDVRPDPPRVSSSANRSPCPPADRCGGHHPREERLGPRPPTSIRVRPSCRTAGALPTARCSAIAIGDQ